MSEITDFTARQLATADTLLNPGAESALLGTALVYRDLFLSDFDSADFHDPDFRRIWVIGSELAAVGGWFDGASIADALEQRHTPIARSVFAVAEANADTPEHAPGIMAQVHDLAERRRAVAVLQNAVRAAYDVRRADWKADAQRIGAQIGQHDAITPGRGLNVVSIREVLTMKFPEPVWAVPGLIPVGLTILAGRPKVGKSWLALQLAQSVATGGMFLGKQVDRGPVLYLALEDPPRRLAERARMQGWQDHDARADFVTVGDFRNDGAALAATIRTAGYRLVIVDTLARAFPGDKNSADEMTAALTPVQEAAHAGNCAVLILHHHNKLGAATVGVADGISEPDPLVNLAGSVAIGGMSDCIAGLYRRGAGKRGVVLCGYGRDVEEFSHTLSFDAVTHCWQIDSADTPSMTAERIGVLEAVDELGGGTCAEVAKRVHGNRGNVHKQLSKLVNAGQLALTDGRYTIPETNVYDLEDG